MKIMHLQMLSVEVLSACKCMSMTNFHIQTNCVDPDQNKRSSLIWVHTVLLYRDILNSLADDTTDEI